MNYELAKKLKDAGFPQNPFRKANMCPCSDRTVETCGTWLCQCKEFIQEPTLEELIEACGGRFSINKPQFESLVREINRDLNENWIAYADIMNYVGSGTTPTEAVANLYLELNKK